MTTKRPRHRLTPATFSGAIAVLAACGGDDRVPGDDGHADPRTREQMCVTYCANAAEHGCASISGWPCQGACEAIFVQGNADCLRLYNNHTGCLADVPNLCDAAVRDEYCKDVHCAMTRACNVPTPQCR